MNKTLYSTVVLLKQATGMEESMNNTKCAKRCRAVDC